MKIFSVLADGFEETEALAVIDVLRRADVEIDVVGLDSAVVTGAHQISVQTDKLLKDLDLNDYSGIILPGGMPGSANLLASEELKTILQAMNKKSNLVAAICAAPIVLANAGIIDEKEVVCYPGFESKLGNAKVKAVTAIKDDNIITGRGPGCVYDFALMIVEYLKNKDVADTLRKAMLI